jgi:hypothetical protein
LSQATSDVEAQQSSLKVAPSYQTLGSHQIVAPSVVVESHSLQNRKANCIFTDKVGSVIEQKWIEEHQAWLTIRVNGRLESECE